VGCATTDLLCDCICCPAVVSDERASVRHSAQLCRIWLAAPICKFPGVGRGPWIVQLPLLAGCSESAVTTSSLSVLVTAQAAFTNSVTVPDWAPGVVPSSTKSVGFSKYPPTYQIRNQRAGEHIFPALTRKWFDKAITPGTA